MISTSDTILKVAAALYSEGGRRPIEEFPKLYTEKQKPWIEDAQTVVAIVGEACAQFCENVDPEKPTAYLHKREHLADEMRARFVWPNI